MAEYCIPLPGGERIVTIEGPFPLTCAEWAQFLAVLAAMMPGLTDGEPPALLPGSARA